MTYWSRSADQDEEVVSLAAESLSGSHQYGAAAASLSHHEADEEEYSDDGFDEYSDEFESDAKIEFATCGSAFRIGDRVRVFWAEESEWFDGVVELLNADQCFVQYDDGDRQWEPVDIIRLAQPHTTQQLQLAASALVDLKVNLSDAAEAKVGERIIIPRRYIPVEKAHFEPVRFARMYRCVVQNHIGSIITPRGHVVAQSMYEASLHCEVARQSRSLLECSTTTRDCEIQTNISSNTMSST